MVLSFLSFKNRLLSAFLISTIAFSCTFINASALNKQPVICNVEDENNDGYIFGDTDLDLDVTAADALDVLCCSLRIKSLDDTVKKYADVDGDGRVSVFDALLILRRSVEKITSFPVQSKGELLVGRRSFAFSTGDSDMNVVIRDNTPVITSLTARKKGVERSSGNTELSLPARYNDGNETKSFEWQYKGYLNKTDEKNRPVTSLVFKDKNINASYELQIISGSANGPFESAGYMTNNTGTDFVFIPDKYFSFGVTGDVCPTAWTFHKESGMAEGWTIYSGTGYSGSGIYKKELTLDKKAVAHNSVNQNWNSSGDIPMMYLDYATGGVYCALEWTNGMINAVGKGENEADISVNIGETGFRTNVPDGTSFYMPTVYLGVYDGDVDDGSNQFKRWFLNCKAPENMVKNPDEPLTQQDMQIGYDVSKYGIQSIKWDYGWWSDQIVNSPWRTNEGLLEVHNRSYLGAIESAGCSNLTEFVNKAGNAGVKLALYVLLKDTQLDRPDVPTSVGAYGHPEWFSFINVTGSACSADLGNTECVDFYKDYMLNFFKSTGVTTWRSDFEPICRSSDKENRHRANGNDVQYWCTVGFSDLVDYLRTNLPDFRYESCSSGGSMKDFFTMTKASVINCDDSADYMSMHMSFYDSSYCIHPAQLQLPVNSLTYTEGSQYYTGTADYDYGLRCVMTGGIMLSNWSGTQKIDTDHWEHNIADVFNKRIKPLMREGDLYHILPRPDGVNWDGIEYVDADSKNDIKGIVMLWKPTDTEGSSKTVKLRGLDEQKNYSLTFEDRTDQNCVMSGKQLMESGITVTINESSGSDMIYLSESK